MLKMHNYRELAEVAGADIHTGLQPSSRAHCLPGLRVYKQYRLLDNYFLLLSVVRIRIRIRIRIHQIHMFLGVLDPDPESLVRGMDPDPDPSIIQQK
jgi:hypothetical protein